MAKLEQGILGPFRGKVGMVVGYLWRGKHVVRGYRREINYPNTENQQLEREWFISMVRFAATARQALLLGLKEKANRDQMTEGNVFVKMNKRCFGRAHAPAACGGANTSGLEGELCDYQHLTLSSGPVAPLLGATWWMDERQVLTASWERRTPLPRCKSSDSVHLYIYNAHTRESLLAASARRSDSTITILLPDHWNRRDLHCYLFATDTQGHASSTAYATTTPQEATTIDTLQSSPLRESSVIQQEKKSIGNAITIATSPSPEKTSLGDSCASTMFWRIHPQ